MGLTDHLARCPLIAILRGVGPDEVEAIGDALAAAGFAIIEVPLNSPEPMVSIGRLAGRFPDLLVGAGTVMTPGQVDEIAGRGGRLIVTPHGAGDVVAQAKRRGMVACPGIATPTEAFAMIAAGADGLKLFPAEASSPAVLRAMRAVLPPEIPVMPVGGIDATNMRPWLQAGAAGFGLGSSVYRPGDTATAVAEKAANLVAGWQEATHG